MNKNNKQATMGYFEQLALVLGFAALGMLVVYFGLGMLAGKNFLAQDFAKKSSFATAGPVPASRGSLEAEKTVYLEAAAEQKDELEIIALDYGNSQALPLSTQVYPGYTMTFEVVARSATDPNPAQVPIFLYTIFDENGQEVFRTAEERIVQGETKFSKKITLPRDLEPGRYKLQIESKVGNNKYTEERYFEVEQSPVMAATENISQTATGLISGIGWIVIILILIFLGVVIFAIVERRIHSGQRHWDSPRAQKSSH